jgi:1,4-dihydroxy-2-naphthoate polyprenyltransferase
MARLAVEEAVRRSAAYGHAVLSWVGADGFPVSVAGESRGDGTELRIGPLAAEVRPAAGQEVCVTFSHIRPRPGVGYDERRYVNLWGPAAPAGEVVTVRAERASGWDEAETPFVEYAERNVPAGLAYLEQRGRRPRLPAFWRFFLATRLPFLTATLAPVALGGAVAAHDGLFTWGWWLLALVSAVAAHLGINIANDLADASGSDAVNVTPTPFSGGSRVLQYGLVSRGRLLALCLAMFGVSIAVGLVLAAARSWELLLLGAVGVVLGAGYSAPPLKLVHRGLGEPVVAAGFGPLMTVGTYLAVTQEWSWPACYTSLAVGILIALVLYVNQIPDRQADAAAGKRTLIVRWSPERVIAVYVASVAVAFALIALGPVLGRAPAWTLIALPAAALARPVVRGLRESYGAPYGLVKAMATNIGLHFATGLLLTAGWLLAIPL